MTNSSALINSGSLYAALACASTGLFPATPTLAQAAPASDAPAATKTAKAAPLTPPATASSSLGNLGDITLDAASNSFGQGYLIYRHAHMVAQNGTKLDADEIRANIVQATNKLQNIVATGNVKTYLAQPDFHRTYTVTSDKAVYDPATQLVNLTGNVKTVVTSTYTTGPFVQTGDSGVIKLGATPDDTQITMNNVHATFTPDSSVTQSAQRLPNPPAASSH